MPKPVHPRTGDDFDPWTLARRCSAEVLSPRTLAQVKRCGNRTTDPSALCWRHRH